MCNPVFSLPYTTDVTLTPLTGLTALKHDLHDLGFACTRLYNDLRLTSLPRFRLTLKQDLRDPRRAGLVL